MFARFYHVILSILTSQKKINMTKLEFLWPVNMTGNFILSPGLPDTCELVQPKIQVNLPQFYQESLG